MTEIIDPVVIWSGEHLAYWKPNCCGYVTIVEEAGVYSREDAIACTRNCGPEKKIEIKTFEQVFPMCKGDVLLGTSCGKCSRCVEERREIWHKLQEHARLARLNPALTRAAEPFAAAWLQAKAVLGDRADMQLLGVVAAHYVGPIDFKRAHEAVPSEKEGQ